MKVNFYYDPKRQGYDTNIWKTLLGAPSVVSDKLRLNVAAIIMYADTLFGRFNMGVNIPVAPRASYLVGGTGATSTLATWAALTDAEFSITIDGSPYDITGIDFKSGIIYTPAFLTGGAGATSVVATWNAVTDGSFNITIDGSVRSVTGLDFSACLTMADVAGVIQAGIRALTSGLETVVWSTDHFVISSVNTTVDSAITVTSAQGGGTDISGAGATDFMDADTGAGNGVVTNKVAVSTMATVASIIQAALRAETGGLETVVWSTDHFVITALTDISVTSAVSGGAGTDISGAGGTAFMDADAGASNEVVMDGNKVWGLAQLNKDVYAYFKIENSVFSCVSKDESGNEQETIVTFAPGYAATDVEYSIDWQGSGLVFRINGLTVANHETRRPTSPMSCYINNADPENVDISFVEGQGVQSYI